MTNQEVYPLCAHVIQVLISFVNNLLTDELFDDILNCDDAQRLPWRARASYQLLWKPPLQATGRCLSGWHPGKLRLA